jgi:AraC-like DNA-binding protein
MFLGDSYIRATQLIGFVDEVQRAGGDPVALLNEVGIPVAALTDIDRLISFRKYALLLELSAQRLGKPQFGLEWANNSPAHFPHLGPLVLLGNYVATVREWGDLAEKYWRFHTNAFVLPRSVDPTTGTATTQYVADSFALPGRQIAEMSLGNLCGVVRAIANRQDLSPKLVRFQHNRPASISMHEQVFRCPIEFDADRTEVLFDEQILDLKTNRSLRIFKSLVGFYIKNRIDRMPVYDASTTTTVGLAIPSMLGTGQCRIEAVAEALGVHSKRLQRDLANEGTNFSEILDKVRENIARRLLVESDIPVERMAGLLEYSATAPFTSAFKRWTGQSPLVFRRTERQRLGLVSIGRGPVSGAPDTDESGEPGAAP